VGGGRWAAGCGMRDAGCGARVELDGCGLENSNVSPEPRAPRPRSTSTHSRVPTARGWFACHRRGCPTGAHGRRRFQSPRTLRTVCRSRSGRRRCRPGSTPWERWTPNTRRTRRADRGTVSASRMAGGERARWLRSPGAFDSQRRRRRPRPAAGYAALRASSPVRPNPSRDITPHRRSRRNARQNPFRRKKSVSCR